MCPRVSGWARHLLQATSTYLSARANTVRVPKVFVLSLMASMNLGGLSKLHSSSYTLPVLFLEKSLTPWPWLLNSNHCLICAHFSLFLAFYMSSEVADQLILRELAIFFNFLSFFSLIRLDAAGSIEFLRFIALFRIPSSIICSNLDKPSPLLAFGA